MDDTTPKEIVIKCGGMYNMLERKKQCLVLIPERPPQVISHDYSLVEAMREAVKYVEQITKIN